MTAARVGWSLGLLAVLVGPALLWIRPGTGVWLQLAELTGLLALSGLAVAAVLPSRLRSLTRTLGVDGVHVLHRTIGGAAVGMVLVHLACVVAADPTTVRLLDPTTAPAAARAATAATVALSALLILTVTRARRRYEAWRWVHLALTVAALAGAALHVWFLGRLMQDPVMATVFTALALGVVAVGWWRWVLHPRDPSTEFVVAAIRPRSPTVSTLFLAPARGRHRADTPALPAVAPGQFAWLRLNRDPASQEHPFSIASASSARRVEFVIRHSGDFTRSLRHLLPGRRVWLDGPHGAFGPDETVAKVALVASGVGIAPMLAILRTAAERGDRRPYVFVQYAQRPDDMLFRRELKDLAEVLDLHILEVVASDPLEPLIAQIPRLHRWDWYVCGPPAVVAVTVAALTSAGVQSDRVHTESF